MTRTDEMVAWLSLQFDDDEETARVAAALTRSPWTSQGSTVICADRFPVVSHGDGEAATAEHIARWDPARALAEVDTKRRILEIHHRIECQHDRNFSTGGDCAECGGEYPCETVRLLALPYAGRPGFPDEWRMTP